MMSKTRSERKKGSRVLALALVFALVLTMLSGAVFAADPDSTAYPNKLADIKVDDPFLFADKDTETYYLYTANMDAANPGIIVYESKDLKNWSDASTVYTVPTGENCWNANEPALSPSVYNYEGKYYLMVTLTNSTNVLQTGMGGTGWDSSSNRWNDKYPKSTVIAVADSPKGLFADLDTENSQGPNQNQVMTMDGSLYVDIDGNAYMVYAHDWAMKIDGIIEFVPMSADLTSATADQKVLFRASMSAVNDDMNYGAPEGYIDANKDQFSPYKAYAPRVYTAPDGSLVMLWTTECHGKFVQVQAVAKTGNIEGRWNQKMPLITGDKGDGMAFETFDGNTMILVENNMSGAEHYVELYDAVLTNDGFKISSHREDLDGVAGVVVADTTAPKIYVPSTRVIETAEDSAAVPFTAMAYDDLEGWVDVSYSIQPGSVFEKGNTTVTVTARDSSGNEASKSFLVTVKDPTPKPEITPTTNSATEYTQTLPNMGCHDPYILADEASQTYYLYTANTLRINGKRTSGVMAYQSKDLKNWSAASLVYEVVAGEGIWHTTAAPWAPEVHYYNGKYYLFTTLHNQGEVIDDIEAGLDSEHWTKTYRRASIIAVSDSPEGPFTEIDPSDPVTGRNLMTLDGTLYVAPDGTPYLVYAHEWVQKLDGTVEAIQLTPDLSAGVGDPFLLFLATDAPWYEWDGLKYADYGARFDTVETHKQLSDKQLPGYVTDGMHLHETPNGSLVTLWTTYRDDKYIMTQAISRTGNIEGPWEQLAPLDYSDAGHSMVFEGFDGKLYLCMHNNMSGGMNGRGGPVRAEIFEVKLTDDGFKILRHCEDIDGQKNVDISDNLAPILFNSVDRYASILDGATAVRVPFAVDAVDNSDLTPDIIYSITPNSLFEAGKTEVSVSVKDPSGNESKATFNVYVTDKTDLNNAVQEAEALNEEDYTPESFEALQDALAESEEVLGNQYASQEEIDAATEGLEDALDNLEEAEEPDDNPINTGSAAPYAMMAMLAVSAAGVFMLRKKSR